MSDDPRSDETPEAPADAGAIGNVDDSDFWDDDDGWDDRSPRRGSGGGGGVPPAWIIGIVVVALVVVVVVVVGLVGVGIAHVQQRRRLEGLQAQSRDLIEVQHGAIGQGRERALKPGCHALAGP